MLPISPLKSSQTDVLIIGAGPAGLMACNALTRAGIDVRIIDQRYDKSQFNFMHTGQTSSVADQLESRRGKRTESILVPLKFSKYVTNP